MMSRFLFLFATLAALTQAAIIPREAVTASNIISVQGTGSVDIPTTQTLVSASIEKTTPCDPKNPNECSGRAAQQEVASVSKGVMEYLKGLDTVTDLTTTNVALNPQYDYPANGKRVLTSYQATNSISFKVDNDAAGDVLDEIVKKGVTSIPSISFVASDEAISAATDEALQKAVKNAQAQANAVLTAIGAKSEGIVNIQVNNAGAPSPVPGPMFSVAAGVGASPAADSTPIEAGKQTVTATVTLNIKYSS